MADDLDFESFDKLDDLDWSELEKDVKEGAKAGAPAGAAPAAASAAGNEAQISAGGSHIDINYLLDVGLQISVEIGRRQYFIQDILSWDPGGIIELDKEIGEPLNLLVNGKPVAKGEVVVANDKFALRITEILDPRDRMAMLQT